MNPGTWTRRWMPRRSLREKLLLVVMLSTSAALLMSAGALLAYEVISNRTARTTDIRSQAQLIAQSVVPALVFDDPKAAKDALDAFRLRPQIEVAAVFGADGRLFASYRRPGNAVPPVPAQPPADGPLVAMDEIRLTQALVQDGERLGTLYLQSHYDLFGRVVDYLGILALASAAGLALAALIFRQLHPSITRPVLAMADVARRIVEGRNYELRVAASSDDEIGVLVAAFNNMLEDLAVEMRERRAAEEALRAADRRKDEFLATLAHELRNPLAPLTAGLALLKRGDEDPRMRARMRDMMERQLKQMVRLIDDLLEVSRITRGKLELRREIVDLRSVAGNALEAAGSALQGKQHTVVSTLPQTPVWVDVDTARLIQVVVNLLNNAARYTPNGGRIELRLREVDEGQVAIDVSDTGIGIDPAQQTAVFGMFYQVDTSLERGAAGLGIGLTIASELVRLHGGSIGVASAGLGQGSTFSVVLPTAAAPTAIAATVATEATAAAPRDILVADDNVDFADSFGAFLRAHGHRVRVAHHGQDALDALHALSVDIAFLDVGMPKLNGLDLATRWRAEAGDRPTVLVAVTGWGQENDRRRVRDAGFDRHLVKPIDLPQALALIAELMEPEPRRRA